MTIANAEKFFQKFITSDEFRTSLYKAEDQGARSKILASATIPFDINDFEDAFVNLLKECQSEDQAEELKEVANVWKMLTENDEQSCDVAKCSGCAGC